MNHNRANWAALLTSLLTAIVSILLIAAATCLVLVQCGCAAVKGNAAGVNTGQQVTADRVELMESAIIDLDRKLEIQASNRQSGQAGRDVTINDPWPLRLLLGGIPASFAAYLLSKRVSAIRRMYDALSGKPCAERQAGRCIPTPDPVPPHWRDAARKLGGVDAVRSFGPQDDSG